MRLDWVRGAFEMRLKRLRCVWIGFEVRLRGVRYAFGLSSGCVRNAFEAFEMRLDWV